MDIKTGDFIYCSIDPDYCTILYFEDFMFPKVYYVYVDGDSKGKCPGFRGEISYYTFLAYFESGVFQVLPAQIEVCKNNACTCNIRDLMIQGCKCGGV